MAIDANVVNIVSIGNFVLLMTNSNANLALVKYVQLRQVYRWLIWKLNALNNVQGNMIQINKTLLVMKGIIRLINFCYAVLESTLIFEVNFRAHLSRTARMNDMFKLKIIECFPVHYFAWQVLGVLKSFRNNYHTTTCISSKVFTIATSTIIACNFRECRYSVRNVNLEVGENNIMSPILSLTQLASPWELSPHALSTGAQLYRSQWVIRVATICKFDP